jgi:hypothetical protein
LFGTAIAVVNPHSWTVRGEIVAAVMLTQVRKNGDWADAVKAAPFGALERCEWGEVIIISSRQF